MLKAEWRAKSVCAVAAAAALLVLSYGAAPLMESAPVPAQAEPNGSEAKPRGRLPQKKPDAALKKSAPAQSEVASPAPVVSAAPQPVLSAASKPQPVQHAREAGMGAACVDAVGRASAATVDAPHAAVSTWFTDAADAHMFEAIVALTGVDGRAVQGATVLSVGPTRGDDGCESTSVQVYPSARTCAAIRQDLLRDSRPLAELAGAPLLENQNGLRTLLLPNGNGCVIVGVGLMRAR